MTGEAGDSKRAPDRDHYSYAHYANRQVAEGFDQLRFGGPIGGYLLATQEALLLEALAPVAGRRILDVGTGTGRAALGLARAGARVVGVDASEEMLDVARERAAAMSAPLDFQIGDAHALAFDDRSFDAVVSLRLLMHVPDWRRAVAELCRVSRWRVVLDFPAAGSLAAVESLARRARHRLGSTVEAYRVLSAAEVRTVLEQEGFHVIATHRQFVLPIALHKRIGVLAVTRAIEGALAAVGLRHVTGSPVTLVAER